jgi:glycerophosphoryl diester phosphodiesterase
VYVTTSQTVQALHHIHMKVIPWTANDPETGDRLIAMKVDGIITDDPEVLIGYLKKKGLR